MKKILSIIMSVVMVLTLSVCAFAAYAPEDEKLSFNSDGKFKIMMINDTQDVGKGNDERTVNFINAAGEARPRSIRRRPAFRYVPQRFKG